MQVIDLAALIPLGTLAAWASKRSVQAYLAQRKPDPEPGYEPVKAVIQSLTPEADGSIAASLVFVLGEVSDTYNFTVPPGGDQNAAIISAVQEEAAVFRPRLEAYQAAATAYAEWLKTHDPSETDAETPPVPDAAPALSADLQALVGYQIEL